MGTNTGTTIVFVCGSARVITRTPSAPRWRRLFTFLLGSMTTLAVPARGEVMYVSPPRNIVQVSPTGAVSLFATVPGGAGCGLAFDSGGSLYAAGHGYSSIPPQGPQAISKVSADGAVSLFATVFGASVWGLAFDPSGNLYASQDTQISKITPSGTVSVFATLPGVVHGLAFDSGGILYAADYSDGLIDKISSTGAVSLFATLPGNPLIDGGNPTPPDGLAFDGSGKLYAAEEFDNQIVQISQDGLTVSPFVTVGNARFVAFGPAIPEPTVPEPSSFVLLAVAAGSLLLRRRRRRA